jgi:hypothetical protein
LSNSAIARELALHRATVVRWFSQGSYEDNRGWQKDQARKYTSEIVAQRICSIKRHRIESNYFVGDEYVQMDYSNLYPMEVLPTLWYITETIRRAKLQTRKPKHRRSGGSEYLLYPIQSIRSLKGIHQSADFIGKKYIGGRTEAINIFSTSYYFPFKLYQIKRIEAEKAIYAIEQLQLLWRRFPMPHVLRLDNGLQFRGTASGKRALGTFLIFLLNLSITPLFGSPSKPWTNPHVEGHNRVFNDKVWRKNYFTSLEQIDQENERFNNESIELFRFKYSQYVFEHMTRLLETDQSINIETLQTRKDKNLYFIRFVESFETHSDAHVTIMNEIVSLPEQYTHQFVFGEWNIETEILSLYSEYNKSKTLIQQTPFKLNL